MFFSFDDFLSCGLPALVDEKARLKALVASYNPIGRYRPGPVVTGDPRLGVLVFRGRREWGNKSVSALVRKMDGKEGIDSASVLTAIEQEVAVEQRMSQLSIGAALQREYVEDPSQTLLIAYAGRYPMFQNSIGETVRFGRSNPGVTTVVVSCTCDVDAKRDALRPLMEEGALTHVVFPEDCGGVNVMSDIVDALTARWFEGHQL